MASSDVFPLWRIAIDALVSALISLLVLLLVRTRSTAPAVRGIGEVALVSAVVGLSVLAWRSFANAPALNADTIPGVSPADALSPIVTYVCLGIYAAFRPASEIGSEMSQWARARALLVVVSFVVNVVVI